MWSADVYLNRLNPFTLLFVAHNRLQSNTNPYIFVKATVVISLKKKTILGKGLFNNNFIYFVSTLFISKSLLQKYIKTQAESSKSYSRRFV